MKKILLAIVVTAAALAATATTPATLPPDSTLRRMAAQMLMVGFKGDSVTDNSDAARYVRDLGVGAVILFDVDLTGDATVGSRNVTSKERLKRMTQQLKRWSRRPLLIALDQEGGRVARLKPQYGYSPTVTAEYLGKTDREDTTRHYAALMARDIAESGVNINIAPVVDLLNSLSPGLGDIQRCFATDPATVTRHASWFIDEMGRRNVFCTLKHFPGHGNAQGDSHLGLVDVTDTWNKRELLPYAQLIGKGCVDLIMTAHIFNRRIDPEYPATLSKKTITGILRDSLYYDGLVVSDDMYMKGIIDNYQIEPAIVLAINAGVDMLCVGNNISTGFEADRPFKLVDIIVAAVKDGRIPVERLVESNRRIARLQQRLR